MKSHSKSGFRQMPEPPTPCTVSHHGRPGNSLAVFSLLGAEAPGKSQLHSPPWGLWGPVAVGCCDAHHLPTRPRVCVPPTVATPRTRQMGSRGSRSFGVGSWWVVRPRTSHALPRAVWKLQRTLDHGKQLRLETGEEMQLAVVYTQPFTDAVSECF